MQDTIYRCDPHSFHGRVEMRPLESECLRDNALGDPHVREVPVYLPPGAEAGDQRYPVIYLLAGLTGRGQSMLETHPWKRGVVSRMDSAMAAGEVPPAILVMPDCFTKLGGSQYVNSSAVGLYEDHVVEELVPFVDQHYPTLSGRRAVCGKSSGGFGALHLGMRHPDLFPIVASISGDCCFEYTFGGEFLACLRGLTKFEGDPARFLESFYEEPNLSGDGHSILNVLAMAACYSPNPESPLGFDLPIDLHTGERIDEIWQRWLAFDPVVACESHADALRSLEWLYVECGIKDEFHLQWGARVLARKLEALKISFDHAEHDGGHFGIDSRYVELIPKLAERLMR